MWCVDPLFIALGDYLVYQQELEYYHWIGIFAIIASTVMISLDQDDSVT